MEFKPWPMTKDGKPKAKPHDKNDYFSEVITMPMQCEDYFSERDLFLMKEALNAGHYYESIGDWLEEVVAEGGYIVAQHLAHDADQIESPNCSGEKMTEHKALSITRNPYGFSDEERREARLLICEKMETYKEAYLNMREYAESQGIDTRAYG